MMLLTVILRSILLTIPVTSAHQNHTPRHLVITTDGHYAGYYYYGLYHLTNSDLSDTDKPEYRDVRYSDRTLLYTGGEWRVEDSGNTVFTNPAQTRLPPQDGWVSRSVLGTLRVHQMSQLYSEQIENAPQTICLNTTVNITTDTYVKSDQRGQEGWSKYQGKQNKLFLYVSYDRNRDLKWMINSRADQAFSNPISWTSESYPSSTPASWPDWTNIGTSDKPELVVRKGSSPVCNYTENGRVGKINPFYKCNREQNCQGDEDEGQCPLLSNPRIYISLILSSIILAFSAFIYMTISHFGFILVDSETVLKCEEKSNMRTLVDILVKLTKKENWGELETVRKGYILLHQTRGGVKLLIDTIFVLIRSPKLGLQAHLANLSKMLIPKTNAN